METQPQQTNEPDELTIKTVKQWSQRVKKARTKWASEFKRMRENMEFSAGLQWMGQNSMVEEDRYVANLVLRTINQKKSVLYCRNPKAIAQRRKRLDFALWDGKVETLISCLQRVQTSAGHDIEAMAILNDYMQGSQRRDIIDKVCKTLEVVYQWNLDEQQPAFKGQMKDLVGRTITCGVGYVRVNFARTLENRLSSSEVNDSAIDRAKRAKMILDRLESGAIDETDPAVEQLKWLTNSLGSIGEEYQDVNERLMFDFPPATSIIPDPRVRSLRGFVGARWLAQEFLLPLDDVNAFFGSNIKPGGDLMEYQDSGVPVESGAVGDKDGKVEQPTICVWEIFDLNTKTHFFICDGWKDYLQAPEPVEPSTKHFWPIVALTFNQVESEPGQKVSPFPPSDVDLIKSAQKEWNRTREALREHRKAAAPKYLTSSDLTDKDKENVESAAPHTVVKLQGVPANSDVSRVFVPIQMAGINPVMYDTTPLQDDILQTSGMQEANLGPVSGKGTATASSIAEQSRLTNSSSNVDDIDDFLTEIAQMAGEMLLKECSESTVKRIAGVGALWPTQNHEDFVNEIYLEIVAASSGRPNKAMDIANFERMAPTLLQAGANPQAIIREAIKRLDDSAEPEQFFPLGLPSQPIVNGANGPQPQQPLQELPSQAPVPLAAS